MTELRRTLPFLLLPLLLVIAGCALLPQELRGTQPNPAQAQPIGAPGAELLGHRNAWQALRTDSYDWQVAYACECAFNGPIAITIEHGVATAARGPDGDVPLSGLAGFPLTVDDLYARASAAIDAGGSVTGTWQAAAVPTTLLIDPIPNAIDDELNVRVLRFTPAP